MNTLTSIQKNSNADTLLLESAIEALGASTGIGATILALEPIAGGTTMDAQIELRAGAGNYPYFVEIKQLDRVATLYHVQQRFAKVNGPSLLVVPRISVELADKCREIGLQFIDANGNAYLSAPGLMVLVKGQRLAKREALGGMLTPPTGVGGAAASRLAFIFLCDPKLLNAPYRALSHVAGVSLGTIGPVLEDLGQRGFILNSKGNRRFLERDRLVNEWVTNYPVRLRPKLAPRRFRAPNRDWWRSVDIDNFDAMWGGEVAADKLTGYLKPEIVTIYMNPANMRRNLSELVVRHRLRADPEGDVEILEKFWNLPENDAAPGVVPPLLVYADLVVSMEPRNLDAAALIQRQFSHGD